LLLPLLLLIGEVVLLIHLVSLVVQVGLGFQLILHRAVVVLRVWGHLVGCYAYCVCGDLTMV
jgi:hypothetical protein